MLKKIILTLVLLTGMNAYADNYLNSVVISKTENGKSIVLRTDESAKIKKTVENNDRIVLSLKEVKKSPDINTLYKNTNDVSGLVIQNDGNNDLKIYIDAPDISKANVIFETPDSTPISAVEGINYEKTIWSIISFFILLIVMASAKNIVEKPVKPDINELIKEREKALYKNFQKEVASIPSINYSLKGYRKHVLKGETIRSYENRVSAKL